MKCFEPRDPITRLDRVFSSMTTNPRRSGVDNENRVEGGWWVAAADGTDLVPPGSQCAHCGQLSDDRRHAVGVLRRTRGAHRRRSARVELEKDYFGVSLQRRDGSLSHSY